MFVFLYITGRKRKVLAWIAGIDRRTGRIKTILTTIAGMWTAETMAKTLTMLSGVTTRKERKMRCERCAASWDDGGMTDCGYECDSYGCLIYGENILLDADCKLTKRMVDDRLAQLKAYEDGKIERPKWVANRFIREMDDHCHGSCLGTFLPGFPPIKMKNGSYASVHSGMDLKDSCEAAYLEGYEDAKAGQPKRKFT
jgi:hypothetical protein